VAPASVAMARTPPAILIPNTSGLLFRLR